MDMNEFRKIVGKRRTGGGFPVNPNSLTQRILSAIPEDDVISHEDLMEQFSDEDEEKVIRTLSNLSAVRGKREKKRKIAKGFNSETKNYYYTRNPEFLTVEDSDEGE